MTETAKENGLSPYAYLKYLLEQLPNIDLEDPAELDRLMPWSNELPALCRGGKPGNQA
jgi:transposase